MSWRQCRRGPHLLRVARCGDSVRHATHCTPPAPLAAAAARLTFAARSPRRPGRSAPRARSLARARDAARRAAERRSLRLAPVGRARDTARGSIVVRFAAKRSADVILDFRGPALVEHRVNGAAAATTFNGAHLRIPADGDSRRRESRRRRISRRRSRAAGASIIRFHDDKDGSNYLYTLLVPSDANLLFPCFDQPDLKARLTLALTVPPRLGGARQRQDRRRRQHGRVDDLSTSARSDPLPTYLFAFAAGPWKNFAAAGARTNLWVRASRASRSRSRLAAGAGRVGAVVARELLRRAVSVPAVPVHAVAGVSRSAAWSIPASRCSTRNRSSTASRPR